jgi:uncharacterized protein (DUF433 family)
MIAEGMSGDEILRAYPDLEREDIRQSLRYRSTSSRLGGCTGRPE